MAATDSCTSCDQLRKRIEELTVRCSSLESENAQLLRQLHSVRPPSATNRPASTSSTLARTTAGAQSLTAGAGPDPGTPSGDTTHCNNCDRLIPSATFSMHSMHCARNIARCPHCAKTVPTRDLTAHIATERGTIEQARLAVETGLITFLQSALQHGADPLCMLNAANGDAWLHVAVRSLQVSTVRLLCSNLAEVPAGTSNSPELTDLPTSTKVSALCNGINSGGETPLHVLCSCKPSGEGEVRHTNESAILDIARVLLAAGVSLENRTVLGDTPLRLAQRNGLHDLAVLLASAQQQSASLRQVCSLSFTPFGLSRRTLCTLLTLCITCRRAGATRAPVEATYLLLGLQLPDRVQGLLLIVWHLWRP